MTKNDFCKYIEESGFALGTWVTFSDPTVTEICAKASFDFLVFDMEHAPLGIQDITPHLLALKGEKTFSIVRILWNEPFYAKQVLDVGAPGIMFPWILTREDAERAVSSCFYPPKGIRGFGPRRASWYGLENETYIERADEEVFCVLQIEHIRAVENLEDILSVPHIDAIFVGPWDLSGSLGILGQMSHPRLEETIDTIIATARTRGVLVGIAAGLDPQEALRFKEKGIHLLTLGTDYGIFLNGALSLLRRARP
jgi:2-dehydro-3-deoxyglucarate aldolase/4-hydroxy-2-oxoheptanedioate aldolase